jgi:catechol 2,3-dioxygenase-like lactoylglutathione lyase family enzyme
LAADLIRSQALHPFLYVHHVKVPVSDLLASRDWYSEVLGFRSVLDFEREDELVGIGLEAAIEVRIWLHHDPVRACAMRGTDLVALSVGDTSDLVALERDLDARGIAHTPITHDNLALFMDVIDPDGIHIRLRAPQPEPE